MNSGIAGMSKGWDGWGKIKEVHMSSWKRQEGGQGFFLNVDLILKGELVDIILKDKMEVIG